VTELTHDLGAIARAFDIPGEFVSAIPTGSGHINDSYCATLRVGGQATRFIFQRINHHIFSDQAALMQNIERVTAHLAAKLSGEPDSFRRTLTLIPTRECCAWHTDLLGNYWRAYRFIEDAHTFDIVESPTQACQAAKAFGHFQCLLADLPAPRLHDTIPDFHHTPKRFVQLQHAITADVANRANLARPEIEFALGREAITGVLLDALLPERVTHNDTKFNNVMLDDRTGEGICVIDLDTVMPGLAPYDFGDMVRTTTSPAAEDEQDLSKVMMQFPMFEALARGYLASASGFLTSDERSHLVAAGKLITFEQGIRFLTDYLAGDPYYKTHRPGQNLDRCRTQFKLAVSIEQQEDAMQRLVESA
jgi:Phosphotransferase enzyme family